MQNQYKIKGEYTKLLRPNWANRIFQKENGMYFTLDNDDRKQHFGRMTDEMFEKVEEERITLCHKAPHLLQKNNLGCFSNEERELCEKALNGELIEREKKGPLQPSMSLMEERLKENGTTYYTKRQMIEIVNEWIDEYLKPTSLDLGYYKFKFKEHLDKITMSEELQKHWRKEETELYNEVPVSDCSDETINIKTS